MKRLLAVTALSLALGGCYTTRPDLVGGRPYMLDTAQQDAIKMKVLSSLKDPYSAMITPAWGAKSKSGEITFCGVVNAKNSFGGYVGARAFMGRVTASGPVIDEVSRSEESSGMIWLECEGRGMVVPSGTS